MSEKTIFERIIDGEIPARVVYEDDIVIAFEDINPQAPIHVLVIPKIKYPGIHQLLDADPSTVGNYIKRIPKVANHLGLSTNGYRVVFNQGEHGQQTVPYIHAHILGGAQLSWPPC